MVRGYRVVFKAPGVVEVESFDIMPPSRDQVLIRNILSLISPGTEIAFLMALPNTPRKFPMYPGYSSVGIIEEVGEGVKDLEKGDLVVATAPHASHVIAHVNNVYKVPEGVSTKDAVFFTLSCIALQGVRKAKIELGESVAIIGEGIVGQLATQLARLNGAIPVIGLDLYDFRLKIARELGADVVLNPRKNDFMRKFLEATDGEGAKVVIEATGSPQAINLALKLASRRGRVVLLGSTRGESTVNFYSDVHKKGLIIIGAHNSIRPRYESSEAYWTFKDDLKVVFRLLKSKRLRVRELLSDIVPFTEAPEVYRRLREEKEKYITIALDWRKA